MNKKLHSVYIISNVFFYMGICIMIYLYTVNDNTPKWLAGEILVILGIIGSSISDMMINVGISGISGISIGLVRCTFLIKYIIFCVVVALLNRYFTQVVIISMILFIVDFIFECILVKQIKASSVSIEIFVEKVKQFDTSAFDKVAKYLIANIIGVLILADTYEYISGYIIAVLACIVIHLYTSEKIIMHIHNEKSWKVRFVLWVIEMLSIAFGLLNYRIITCSLLGLYCMVVVDLSVPKKTSLIRKEPL